MSSINVTNIKHPSSASNNIVLDSSGNVALRAGSASTPALQPSGDTNTGIFFPAADTIAFAEGGVEAARLDASGRLLVGTTTGSQPLSVVSSQSSKIQFGQAADKGGFLFSDGDGSFGIAGGGYYNGTNWVAKNTASSHMRDDGDGIIKFFTNSSLTAGNTFTPTERMRLDSAGNALFGVTTTSNLGTSNSSFLIRNDTTNVSSIQIANRNSGSTAVAQFFNTNGQVGSITTSGSATAYNTSSDYRLKENVVPLIGAVARLNQLQVHRFNFKADPETTVDGFIAHEAQEVVPECVTGEKDAVDDEGNPVYQGIDQSKLVPLLTAALQEAIGRIETLEAEVATLKAS